MGISGGLFINERKLILRMLYYNWTRHLLLDTGLVVHGFVSLVCTSQPLHSNLKCLALCGVVYKSLPIPKIKPWGQPIRVQAAKCRLHALFSGGGCLVYIHFAAYTLSKLIAECLQQSLESALPSIYGR